MIDTAETNALLKQIDPDIRPLIAAMISGESWAHKASSVPEVVSLLSEALPKTVTLPVDNSYIEIVDKFIKTLAHLDAEVFFVSMLHLEQGSLSPKSDLRPGWGSFVYVRAIELSESVSPLTKEARVITARMVTILRSSKIVDMFLTNLSTDTARSAEDI